MAGLFQGITPTVLGILPYAGIAFTINEQGKRRVSKIICSYISNILVYMNVNRLYLFGVFVS